MGRLTGTGSRVLRRSFLRKTGFRRALSLIRSVLIGFISARAIPLRENNERSQVKVRRYVL